MAFGVNMVVIVVAKFISKAWHFWGGFHCSVTSTDTTHTLNWFTCHTENTLTRTHTSWSLRGLLCAFCPWPFRGENKWLALFTATRRKMVIHNSMMRQPHVADGASTDLSELRMRKNVLKYWRFWDETAKSKLSLFEAKRMVGTIFIKRNSLSLLSCRFFVGRKLCVYIVPKRLRSNFRFALSFRLRS